MQNIVAVWQRVNSINLTDQSILKDFPATDMMAEVGICCPTTACIF
jgi:hypothetical protein